MGVSATRIKLRRQAMRAQHVVAKAIRAREIGHYATAAMYWGECERLFDDCLSTAKSGRLWSESFVYDGLRELALRNYCNCNQAASLCREQLMKSNSNKETAHG